MKKLTKMLTTLSLLSLTVLLIMPMVANAQWSGDFAPGDVIAESETKDLINPILLWIFGIIGIICVVMIVIGGVGIATSADNEEKRKKNIKTVTWALIGLVIILIAYSLVAIVGGGITGKFN